ncbi:hypothetical protein AX14_008257 [Amanita brunnescens Koide BX004]|nr:hypothetical protein AX14_008257 [Amanita brunnescens Koide BX004]
MPTTDSIDSRTASLPESQGESEAPPAPLHIRNHHWTLVTLTVTMTHFTLGIPAYHASLAIIASDTSMLDLKAVVPVWEAVRHFDTILLAAIVTALFKGTTQDDPVYWFFITSSLLQASMGLICSTILIIMFLGSHNEYIYNSAHEDRLRLLCWSVWDHFSLPAISTVWSILMFMTALIVDAVWPNAARNNCLGQDDCFTVAKAMLFLVLCFAAARFGVFMVQLRRISQALYQAQAQSA